MFVTFLQNWDSWREVTLLSVPSRVFCKIALARVDPNLGKSKLALEKDVSVRNRYSRSVTSWSIAWNTPLFINCIDFQKVFDSVLKDISWKILGGLWNTM
jgi:hypothetical protein